MRGIIFDVKRYSIHDGPGLRTTVFFKGCPLRCIWCHNPESQKSKPQIIWHKKRCMQCLSCVDACQYGAILMGENGIEINKNCILCGDCVKSCPTNALEMIGKEYEVSELMSEILKDEKFFEDGGGVTISGGEPFVQYDFLIELLKLLKNEDIHIALDTTGYVDSEKLFKAAELVNLFLYDIKFMNSKRHKHYTGVSNELILENLKILDKNGSKIAVRIPVIPSINDDYENLEETIQFISSLNHIESIDLLPFHSMMADKYKRLKMPFLIGNIKEPDKEYMNSLKKRFEILNVKVRIGG